MNVLFAAENPFEIGSPLLYFGLIVFLIALIAIIFGIQYRRENSGKSQQKQKKRPLYIDIATQQDPRDYLDKKP